LKEPMVKLDDHAHSILKKWKNKLRQKGVRVPLGGTIREMDKLINNCEGISQKDIKETMNAIEKLKNVWGKYNNPDFSDTIREMDTMIRESEK